MNGKPKSIALAALEIESPEDRQAYVDAACGEDRGLRCEVMSLLDQEQPPGGSLSKRDDPKSDVYDKIDSLCQTFTDTWSPLLGDTSRSLEDLEHELQQVGKDARPTLLRNLLHIDLEKRRGRGQQPRLDDYVQRLPAYASLIRQVFLHSSSKFDGEESALTATHKPPAARHLGDYRIVRQIGRGGMGFVFEAVHLLRKNRVALKTLPVSDGPALYRFKREFRAIADLNHPNLVGLHELESDGAQWFITMDLIDGTDFVSYVRPGGVLDESRLASLHVTAGQGRHGVARTPCDTP